MKHASGSTSNDGVCVDGTGVSRYVASTSLRRTFTVVASPVSRETNAVLADRLADVVGHAEEAHPARRQQVLVEHLLEVLADLRAGRALVEAGVRAGLVDRVGPRTLRVHAVERRGLVQAHERVGVVPVASRGVPTVHHHHVGVGFGDSGR